MASGLLARGSVGSACGYENVTIKKDWVTKSDIDKMMYILLKLSNCRISDATSIFDISALIKKIAALKKASLYILFKNTNNVDAYIRDSVGLFKDFFSSSPNKQYIIDNAEDKINAIIYNTKLLIENKDTKGIIQFKQVPYSEAEVKMIQAYRGESYKRSQENMSKTHRKKAKAKEEIKNYADRVNGELKTTSKNTPLTSRSIRTIEEIKMITISELKRGYRLSNELIDIIERSFDIRFKDNHMPASESAIDTFKKQVETLLYTRLEIVSRDKSQDLMDTIIRKIYACHRMANGIITPGLYRRECIDFYEIWPNDIVNARKFIVIVNDFSFNIGRIFGISSNTKPITVTKAVTRANSAFRAMLTRYENLALKDNELRFTMLWWAPFIPYLDGFDNRPLGKIIAELMNVDEDYRVESVESDIVGKNMQRELAEKLGVPSKSYFSRLIDRIDSKKSKSIEGNKETRNIAEKAAKNKEARCNRISKIKEVWGEGIVASLLAADNIVLTRLWYMASNKPDIEYGDALRIASDIKLYVNYMT